MKPQLRSFLLFATGWIPVSVGLFLLISGFFTAWEGQVVSVRNADPELPKLQVLVVTDETEFERHWPRWALEDLDLRIDPRALPSKPLPEGLPTTVKERFTLSFTLTSEQGVRTLSTATPQTLGLALFAFVFGLLGRNMLVAGNPFSLEPRGVELVKAQAQAGNVAPPAGGKQKAKRKGRKGPPPPKRRRGSGRRR